MVVAWVRNRWFRYDPGGVVGSPASWGCPVIVYVVSRGEKHEGGTVVSVWSDETEAVAAALDEVAEMPDPEEWEREGLLWEGSCLFVKIEAFELDDPGGVL